MKRLFIALLVVVYMQLNLCASDKIHLEQNPNLLLNPQDVPIFYDNNPLTGMQSFTVITCLPMKTSEAGRQIEQSIEQTLKKVGEVVHLKESDMRGFGAGNVFLVQMHPVKAWDGSEIPISRISLSVETPVALEKTGAKTFPIIWSINTFLQGNQSSESTLTKAVQKLVGDFVKSYQYANKDRTIKPLFYTYN